MTSPHDGPRPYDPRDWRTAPSDRDLLPLLPGTPHADFAAIRAEFTKAAHRVMAGAVRGSRTEAALGLTPETCDSGHADCDVDCGETMGLTWQAVWNVVTGATPTRPGCISHTPVRCRACSGRQWSVRRPDVNMARTGSPYICGECRGTGRGTGAVRAVARYAAPPT